MKAKAMWCAGLLALSLAAQPAFAKTHFNISVNLGAGRPFYFERAPRVVMVPSTDVAYVQDYRGYDMYRYGDLWYAYDGSRWYRSSNYNGPWGYVELRSVPRQVVYVPNGYARMMTGREWRDDRDDRRAYRNGRNGWFDRDGNWHAYRRHGRGWGRDDNRWNNR